MRNRDCIYIAVSHSKDAIRVNAVLPGPVDTPLLTTGMPEAFLEDMKSKFYQNVWFRSLSPPRAARGELKENGLIRCIQTETGEAGGDCGRDCLPVESLC